MKHDQFVGEIQNRAELASRGEAIRAIRCTLTTLGERLQPGEAKDLAGQLPMEVDRFLLDAESGQRFSYDEYLDRVADCEGVEHPEAARHARLVVGLVSETVYASEIQEVLSNLPDEYLDLFELVDEEVFPK
jgi:uncharacterized protein (DUF2267 family)